jgi:cell division septal protein FtsQ
MNGRNVNPENRDFIIREAEKIIEEYIRERKLSAGARRRQMLRREYRMNRLRKLLFGFFLVAVIGVLVFLLIYVNYITF